MLTCNYCLKPIQDVGGVGAFLTGTDANDSPVHVRIDLHPECVPAWGEEVGKVKKSV